MILSFLNDLDFLQTIWLLPIAYTLHEAEEWNILGWYQRNYVDLPPKTNASIRFFLVFASVVGFVWTSIAVVLGNPRVAAFVLFPAAAAVLQNALQHIYWLVLFREYAPGLVTSVLLLIPIISYLVLRAIRERYVPLWYVLGLALLTVPGWIQTVKAGNRLTPQFRAIHSFSTTLLEWIRRG